MITAKSKVIVEVELYSSVDPYKVMHGLCTALREALVLKRLNEILGEEVVKSIQPGFLSAGLTET